MKSYFNHSFESEKRPEIKRTLGNLSLWLNVDATYLVLNQFQEILFANPQSCEAEKFMLYHFYDGINKENLKLCSSEQQ